MLRLVFMGSPDFAVPTLSAIVAAGHQVVCVYSQPARPAGRGQELRPTPVALKAQELGIEVRTPVNLKAEEDREAFRALNADAAVVVAYGLILPKAVLSATRLGCLNLHGSLLPRWRGAAPIQRAIMAGDATTGVQVMQMEKGLDTGPVMLTAETPIGPEDTTQSVHDRLAALGAPLMVHALGLLESGEVHFTPQSEEGATYAAKIDPAEARIDWTKPAAAVSAHIRGLSPHPGAWFEADLGKGPARVKVLNAVVAEGSGQPGEALDSGLLIGCGEGAIRITLLQRAGRGPMYAEEFLRGSRIEKGARLA
jgi:methionyl-tRNA formyltransferase